jgi:hypothetical protein
MKARAGAVLVLAAWAWVMSGAAFAADAKASATGTWKSEFTTQNGQTFTTTFKLKQAGDKLTGTVTGRNGQEAKIENGKVSGAEVSFQVTRERNGNTFTIKYKGKLSSDAIKGKIMFNFNGEDRERDWEAKREKAEK